jgi:glycerol-3-phosphate cytidylyltransferase
MINKENFDKIKHMCGKNDKVGIVTSAFDLLHAGHMLMLKEAKKHCDCLIAALQKDPSQERPEKNKPIMSLEERILLVEGNKYIDNYIIYETENDLFNILIELHPDIRFIGKDWKEKNYTGKTLSIPIYWIDRNHGYSTSELRNRIFSAEYTKSMQEK